MRSEAGRTTMTVRRWRSKRIQCGDGFTVRDSLIPFLFLAAAFRNTFVQ